MGNQQAAPIALLARKWPDGRSLAPGEAPGDARGRQRGVRGDHVIDVENQPDLLQERRQIVLTRIQEFKLLLQPRITDPTPLPSPGAMAEPTPSSCTISWRTVACCWFSSARTGCHPLSRAWTAPGMNAEKLRFHGEHIQYFAGELPAREQGQPGSAKVRRWRLCWRMVAAHRDRQPQGPQLGDPAETAPPAPGWARSDETRS